MVRHFRQRWVGIEELDPWATATWYLGLKGQGVTGRAENQMVGRKSSHPGMPECGETQSLTEKDKCTGKIKREPRKGKKVVKYREIGGNQKSWVERATRGVRS